MIGSCRAWLSVGVGVLLLALWAPPAGAEPWKDAYLKGIELMDARRWDEAAQAFGKAAEGNPRESPGVRLYGMRFGYFPHRDKGIALYHLGQWAAAVAALEESLRQGHTEDGARHLGLARKRLSSAVASPAPQSTPGNRWAVVIGVGNYESTEISRLRYTLSDAQVLYETLIGPGGFKKEQVMLLTDSSSRRPTLRNIRWALGTWLSRSAGKDDTVLIFFAGHGAPEVDPRGIERDGLAKYLVPIDADPDDLYSTALPMDELQTIFGRIEAERVVVFLDACYSGAAGGRTFVSKRTRASQVDDLFLERLTRSRGRAIVTASRPAELSIELPELGHGIFTYYLVQGLNGAADLNKDGIVTLQELYEYLEQQVTQKSRAVGGNQHPVMKGEMEGVLPLVKVPGR